MAGLYTSVSVYLEKYESGELSGVLVGPINCTSLTLGQEDAETINRTSYLKGQRGQTLDSISVPGSQTVSMTTDEMGSAEMYAFAVLGSTESITQSAGDVTGEEITVVALDKWHKLAGHNVSSVTVAGKTLGTDYALNLEDGLIKPLSTGTISVDDTLTIGYTKAAVTGQRVNAAQVSSITAKIHLFGTNEATDKDIRGYISKAVLAPDGDQELIGDDFVQLTLSGPMVTPDGETTPYVIDFDS